MTRESKYASCLNALDEMQQSVIYAARKGYLAEAESIIVRLESETAEQRDIIDEQVEENRGLRRDVLLMQKANAEQRAEIEQQAKEIAQLQAVISAVNKDGLTDAVMNAVIERNQLQAQLETAKREVLTWPVWEGGK